MKTKLKRFLSLFASAAIAATTVTAVTLPAAADTASTSVILFSDNFDSGYTGNKISKHSSEDYSNLTRSVFETSDGIGISDEEEYFYAGNMAEKGDADNVFVLKDNAGVGSNKALNVTTQAGLNSCSWMVKNSGITSDTINGKALTFTADVMIPADNGFNKGNGVFVYLDALGEDNKPTTKWAFGKGLPFAHNEGSTSDQAGSNMWKKTLLGIESWNWWTTNPCIIAFGEKVQNIEVGEKYSYKLTLIPDSEGKYTAKANVNGTEYELAGTNLPTVEEMSAYTLAMIAEKSHPTYISSCYKDSTDKYQNDKTIALLDNLSLTASAPPKSDKALTDVELGAYGLIDEGFEDYTDDYVKKASAQENKQYEKNSFVLNFGANSTNSFADDETVQQKIEAGDIAKLGKISKDGKLGSGNNYLNIQSQAIVQSGTMWQRSNITADRIKDKTLVFKTKFKIPSDSQWGNGFGAAVILSGAEDGFFPQGAAGSWDMSVDRYSNCKYRLATIITDSTSTKFQVFGENVGDVIKGTEYDVTVTMIPDTQGKYTVTAQLNNEDKVTLKGKKTYNVNNADREVDTIPTVEEFGKYSFVGVTSHTHKYFALKNFSTENKYKANKDLIYFDDISLKRANNFVLDTTKDKNGISDLTTEGELDMAKKYITLNLGEAIDTVNKAKITIDNGASVKSAEIDTTDKKKLKIEFDNLKLNTGYTINVTGVVNPIGVEYSGTLSLRTSAGIDVDYKNIKLEDGTDGKKKVTVPVTKQTGVTDTVKPAVIVYVYDGSETDAPLIKYAYAKEEVTSTETANIEVTGIEVGEGDKVRVFVWDGFSSMKPLTQRIDLK